MTWTMKVRRRWNIFFLIALLFILVQYFGFGPGSRLWRNPGTKQQRFPLAWRQMNQTSKGGVWYIPDSWLPLNEPQPETILEAAILASEIAEKQPQRFISNTRIPRIIHQTWKSTNIDHIPDTDLTGIEAWLQYATGIDGEESAYMFWNDEGSHDLMEKFEPEAIKYIDMLPSPVEKSDAFRVIVCNTIGGVYADIDTMPLRNPATWIGSEEVTPWKDPETGNSFGPLTKPKTASSQDTTPPIGLLLGLEADLPEDTDTFWRTGYEYPVQLTQWALAGAKDEPIMNRYIQNLQKDIRNASQEARANGVLTEGILKHIDTIVLTGPAAVTKAAMDYLVEEYDLRWQALSGIDDGGRCKTVGSTLILPITAFSPGRGIQNNMGSKPITHHDARLQHNFQGSWKKLDVKVEMGKFCRTFLGGCRYWSKAPS